MSEIKPDEGIIPFPKIFEKMCRSFSITKQECWEVLFLLRDTGFIEINNKQGIKILKEILNKEEKVGLKAIEVPATCLEKCDRCKNEFDAKITITSTCNKCIEEINKRIEDRVKEEIKKGNGNAEWVIKINALLEEYGK